MESTKQLAARSALVLGLLLVVPGITPSSQKAPVAPQAILREDDRLSRRVTLQLVRRSIAEVVRELQRQAGVSLTAARPVADEPVIVIVADQPLKQVMHHMATLLNYRWTRKGAPDNYSYEIYQDLQSRQAEEALRDQEQDRALDALRIVMRQRLELLRRPPEELVKEADRMEAADARTMAQAAPQQLSDARTLFQSAEMRAFVSRALAIPRLRAMADPLQRALLRLAVGVTTEQWNVLGGGGTLVFSTRPGPGALPMPQGLADEMRNLQPVLHPPGVKPRFHAPEDEGRYREHERRLRENWRSAEEIRVVVWLELVPRALGPVDFVARPSEAVPLEARLVLVPLARPPRGVASTAGSPHGLTISGEEAPQLTEGPVVNEPYAATEDAILTRERVLKLHDLLTGPASAPVLSINEALPRIAETYGINIIADGYRQSRRLPMPPPFEGPRSLLNVMNAYVSPVAEWRKDGEFLLVRRHSWYFDRLAEIPRRVIREWSARLHTRQQLTLEDATSLVLSLTDRQLEGFEDEMRHERIQISSVVGGGGAFHDQVWRNRNFLRSYGSLLPGQRRQLEAGGSVAVTQFSPEMELA